MDNITHSLTGLMLARSGLNRLTPRATLLLILAANAPDVDIIAAGWGPLAYFEAHRGWTHCLLMLPAMAALSVFVTRLVGRKPLPWGSAMVAACIGVASHLVLDWTNAYGIRLLLPFSSRWFHLDWTGLYDLVLWTMLGAAAVWPYFGRLVGGEIGQKGYKGRGSAVAALVFFALFDGSRAFLHGGAVQKLNATLYDGQIPMQVAALPSNSNPLAWTGVVETAERFRMGPVDAMDDADSVRVFEKIPFDRPLDAARATEPFRYLQYFARFPVWLQEPASVRPGHGTRVVLTDLQLPFHAVALVSANGQVQNSEFTFGSGKDLGWEK